MSDEREYEVFGRFLRYWRTVFSLSQQELAERLGSSPRHISRLENGYCRPGESLVRDIASVLSLGRRDENHLLISAGYSISLGEMSGPEISWLRKAIQLTLRSQDPYPSMALNRSAEIIMVNRGWVEFYRKIMDKKELDSVYNFYDLVLKTVEDPNAESVQNALALILMSIKQSALFTSCIKTQESVDRISERAFMPSDWERRAANTTPSASFRLRIKTQDGARAFLNVGTMIGQFGPNAFISDPYITVMSLYPDDDTDDLFHISRNSVSHPLLSY